MPAASLPFPPPKPKSGIICWLGAKTPPKRSSNNSPLRLPLEPYMSCMSFCMLPCAASVLSISANIELLAIAKSTVPDVYVAGKVGAGESACARGGTARALAFGAAN